ISAFLASTSAIRDFNVETLSLLRVRSVCTIKRLAGSLGIPISARLGSNLLRLVLLRHPRRTR
ncbi:MAG: hypothetical protein ACRD5L_16980, partial [Bryobacteraceae bacterium]